MKLTTNLLSYTLAFFSLAFSPQAYCWTVEANFEAGTPNSPASGTDAYTDPFLSVHSNSIAVHGNQSAEASIGAGKEGFGEWGGRFAFPNLSEGEEIWFRVFIYYPDGFDFSNNGVGVKTLRIHTASASGENEGYFDLLSNSGGVTIGSEIHKEYYENNPNWKELGVPITTGRWHAYEQYVKLSSVPGQGIYRTWQDGKLLLEDTQSRTLRSSTSKSDFIYIWSYWNGTAPKAQKAYLDHVVITNEPPATKDSLGNTFIGMGDIQLLAPPKPPTITK